MSGRTEIDRDAADLDFEPQRPLKSYPGPLFMPRLIVEVRLLWVTVIGAFLAAIGIGVALLTQSLGYVLFSVGLSQGLLVTFCVIFAFGPPVFALVYLTLIRRRLAKRLIHRRLQVCVYCGHDLSGRPASVDICPECGDEIARKDAILYWRGYLRGTPQTDVDNVLKNGR